jgi:hypothetical protein
MGLHPDARQVRHGIDRRPGAREAPFHRVPVRDHAPEGRTEQNGLADFPGLLDGPDFGLAHVEKRETTPGRVQHSPASFAGTSAVVPQSAQIFLLGRHQLRREEFEQRGVLLHHLAGEIDMELLEPAVHLGADLGGAGLVVGDVAPGPDGANPLGPDRRSGAETHVLPRDRVDGDMDAPDEFVLVHRNEVHAHFALSGFPVDFQGIHGRAPVGDFSLAGLLRARFLRGLGNQLHAADGAISRLVPDDPGMHGTSIADFAGFFRIPGKRRHVGRMIPRQLQAAPRQSGGQQRGDDDGREDFRSDGIRHFLPPP